MTAGHELELDDEGLDDDAAGERRNPFQRVLGPQLLRAEPWMARGVCHVEKVDPAVFFPVRGSDVWTAKAFCRRCPVQTDCLEYALREREDFGVWGGESERSRRRLLKARNDSRKDPAV